MKRIVFFISIALIATSVFSQADTLTYDHANQLYEKGEFDKAIPIYEQLIQQNGPSADIYYNLGNAYYKTNQIGKSILNYEKCLKYEPGDEDAKYNLTIANLRIKDKMQPVDEFILKVWWNDFILLFTTARWELITLIAVWIALGAFLLFLLARSIPLRKTGFYLFLPFIAVFIICLIAVFSSQSYQKHYRYAVITDPSAIIKNEPTESSTNLTIIHEGLKIRVMDSEDEWTKIKMADGNEGWLLTSEISEI